MSVAVVTELPAPRIAGGKSWIARSDCPDCHGTGRAEACDDQGRLQDIGECSCRDGAVLSRRAELKQAIAQERPVILVRTEAKAEQLAGLLGSNAATTSPTDGYDDWLTSWAEELVDAKCIFAMIDDAPWSSRAVESLRKATRGEVREVDPYDAVVFGRNLTAGDSPADVLEQLQRCTNPSTTTASTERESQSASSRLVRLTQRDSGADLFHDDRHDPYATFTVDGHRETWRLRDRNFQRWLSRMYHAQYHATPPKAALDDAMTTLEGDAIFSGTQRAVNVRLATLDEAVYLDLGRSTWDAAAITAAGWEVVALPPVRFRRSAGLQALPIPEHGGSLDELREVINVSDNDWPLVRAWLVAAARGQGPFPVLVLTGEHGSAKSTTARVLRSLIDPSAVLLRAEPRDNRDLMISATNNWVVAFENVSHIQPWLSDAICRLATGGGFATRTLHTNDDEMLFDAQRPVIINGIDDLVGRSDLLDRSLLVELPRIPPSRRREESELWAAFERARPRLLGSLLDDVAGGLAHHASTCVRNLPRMADFARFAIAAEPRSGEFLAAYENNRTEAAELGIESNPVAQAVRLYLTPERHADERTKTATEWLTLLGTKEVTRQKGWPTSAKAMANALRRAKPDLRAIGIVVEFTRGQQRKITLRSEDGT